MDYQRKVQTSESFIEVAQIRLLLARLGRRRVTIQAEPEWGKTTKYCGACSMPRRVATGTDPTPVVT